MTGSLRNHWCAALLFALVTLTGPAQAIPFDIVMDFENSGLSSSQQAVFTQAESIWESLITGYQSGITVASLQIQASSAVIDNQPGGALARAGPTHGTNQGGFLVATRGVIEIDTVDLLTLEMDGILLNVVTHEMAHVMGFGTLWTYNGVYVNGSGQYTGENALAAYQAEFDPTATFVPVELEGGPGTANAHWDENNGTAPTGVVNDLGWDMAFALMTGWHNTPGFISDTTVQSFVDIGYVTSVQVPEPATIWLLSIGLAGVFMWAPKRRRTMDANRILAEETEN